jgi:hypothetical protein
MQLALVFAVCAIAVTHITNLRVVTHLVAALLVFCALLVALVDQVGA